MHTPSLHHWHVLERSLTTIKQHATATLILAIAIILVFGYALSIPPERARMLQLSIMSEGRTPLSPFVDPQYAPASAAREQIITNTLAELRRTLQADRAYVAVYGISKEMRVDEYRVIRVFEATAAGMRPTVQRFEGLTRSNWLLMEDSARGTSWLFGQNLPKTYGLELYDEHKTPIGYLGMEKRQENLFDERAIQRLRETARSIATTLFMPVEH